MPRNALRLITIGLIPFLGACAATAIPPASTGTSQPAPINRLPSPVTPAPQVIQPTPGNGFLTPRVMSMPGLEGVIGADSAALQRQFGSVRLDVIEGDVQKLQFSGDACVLDVYLYPLSPGSQPTATYVDARRASDGLDVDRASCVAALKR